MCVCGGGGVTPPNIFKNRENSGKLRENSGKLREKKLRRQINLSAQVQQTQVAMLVTSLICNSKYGKLMRVITMDNFGYAQRHDLK